ncbi:hypothetical protein SOVF_167710 [Spinacia oleracea]|uniref:Uncharacterized protein At1g76070 n=1 Tax=Spinacia oleracea TaxID=3562 RepID=A0A9R0JLQ7_SPIOL|nr:uncharacterized protein At1g76070 [Spinacia oleracea]KNA07868.1 hypothetical protein SOVF_167710 [Spinacia oleracea]
MDKEKENKPKSLFLKFLPKAASAVSFQNPHFSPGRDHHHHNHHANHHNNHQYSSKLKTHAHKGFSGPINYSVLPDEAREKPKKDGSFEAHEPTSPKVSCMGQIKYKHTKNKLRKIASKNNNNSLIFDNDLKKKTTKSSAISKFFNISKKKSMGYPSEEHGKEGRRATLDNNNSKKKTNVPSLGMMNKFASGRESLASFDWTAQIAPIDHDRDYYSDDDQERRRDDDSDDEEEREVIIPYSAPMLIGGRSRGGGDDDDGDDNVMRTRKEVNLWKRRTMAPPPPLALNSKVRS